MPRTTTEPIHVGCEVFVRKGDTLLLLLRKNCFGAGTWSLPGGHLEYNERIDQAAARELGEELGVTVRPEELRLASVVESLPAPDNDDHYLHLTFELVDPAWEPTNAEPEFCAGLQFFALDAIPENFFPPHKGIIENYLANRIYDNGA